jgi:hypothetical protein
MQTLFDLELDGLGGFSNPEKTAAEWHRIEARTQALRAHEALHTPIETPTDEETDE